MSEIDLRLYKSLISQVSRENLLFRYDGIYKVKVDLAFRLSFSKKMFNTDQNNIDRHITLIEYNKINISMWKAPGVNAIDFTENSIYESAISKIRDEISSDNIEDYISSLIAIYARATTVNFHTLRGSNPLRVTIPKHLRLFEIRPQTSVDIIGMGAFFRVRPSTL